MKTRGHPMLVLCPCNSDMPGPCPYLPEWIRVRMVPATKPTRVSTTIVTKDRDS